MSTYGFKLRVTMARGRLIQTDNNKFPLPINSNGSRLWIESADENKKLSETHVINIRGQGFINENEALNFGKQMQQALLIAGSFLDIGFDVGRIQSSEPPLATRNMGGIEFRLINDVDGVVVFPDVALTAFARINPPTVSNRILETQMQVGLNKAFELTTSTNPQTMTALELYSLTRFEISDRARFLLLISTVESLTEQIERTGIALDLVKQFIDMTKDAIEAIKDNEDEKISLERLKGTLVRERNESINRTCWDFINNYLGKSKADDFKKWYSYRSELVHSGKFKKQIDLRTEVYNLDRLVRELLIKVVSNVENL